VTGFPASDYYGSCIDTVSVPRTYSALSELLFPFRKFVSLLARSTISSAALITGSHTEDLMKAGKQKRAALVAVFGTVASLLMMTATPASAATGSGGSITPAYSGDYNFGATEGVSASPPCGSFPSGGKFTSRNWVGTYTATDRNPGSPTFGATATYAGPITATMENTEPYFANPTGTYADARCTIPKLVPAKGTVFSTGTPTLGSSVNCTYTTGTFQRRGTETVQDLSGTCKVAAGPVTVDQSRTHEVREGTISGFAVTESGTRVQCTPQPGPPTYCPSQKDVFVAHELP